MRIHHVCALALGVSALPAAAEPEVDAGVKQALERMRSRDPSLQTFLDGSDGYVVFPERSDRGVLYVAGRAAERVSVNRPVGAQVIAFYSKYGVERLRTGAYPLEASAEPLVLAPGAAAKALYIDGVAVFTLTSAPPAVVRHQVVRVDR